MFDNLQEKGYHCPIEGIWQKTLVYGSKTLMAEFRLKNGSRLPQHAHPHEQTGYLVRGRIQLTIGGRTRLVSPGDSWCIPGGVEHSAETLEDALAVEVFSPVREDYLPAGSI